MGGKIQNGMIGGESHGTDGVPGMAVDIVEKTMTHLNSMDPETFESTRTCTASTGRSWRSGD